MGNSLAERQRNMKMRKGLPQPKLTRTAALNAMASQIAKLPDGPDKAALLARYLSAQGRRRIKPVKRATPDEKPARDLPADEAIWRRAMRLLWAYELLKGQNIGRIPGGDPTEEELALARTFDDSDHFHTAECDELHRLVDLDEPADCRRVTRIMTWMQKWRDEDEMF